MLVFLDWLAGFLKTAALGLVVVALMVSFIIWDLHRKNRRPKNLPK